MYATMFSRGARRAIAAATILAALPAAARGQVLFSAAGANGAAIQSTVDAFRTSLGALNPNTPGSAGSGRREINWDGVPAGFAAPNSLPLNFFNTNSPRGAVFATPGLALEVSGATTDGGVGQPALPNFGDIDFTYSTTFAPFSAQRLFTAVGSNVVDVSFFIPGSTTPALVRGFGAVFSDVDLANTTSIQFFDAIGASLGSFFAPATVGSQTFSFLGVLYASPTVSRVRITAGNAALGAGVVELPGATRDLVVMDDFIYGEPVLATATITPEPTSLGLLAIGLAVGMVLRARSIRRRG